MHTCVKEKKSFINFPTLILYLKLQTSIFGRFGFLTLRVLVGGFATFRHFDANCGKTQYVSGPLQDVNLLVNYFCLIQSILCYNFFILSKTNVWTFNIILGVTMKAVAFKT